MINSKRWFVIINPTSGNGLGKKKWPKIKAALEKNGFDFDFSFTEYSGHSNSLTQKAVDQGFKNIISVGGDGTLHNIINGLKEQSITNSSEITFGVIPIGTGNDWVKTYNIPPNFEKAISIIKTGNTKLQDLGKIEFTNAKRKSIYFNNLAGVGFDGHVVSKVSKFKHLGAFAYLIGAISGLFSFKNFNVKVILDDNEVATKSLMVLIGLCKYSGGGMLLTKDPNPNDGFFDVSIAKNLNKLEIIRNLFNLFNGKIVSHSKVSNHKAKSLSVIINQENAPFVEADGELLGKGNIRVSIIPKAFSFYCD